MADPGARTAVYILKINQNYCNCSLSQKKKKVYHLEFKQMFLCLLTDSSQKKVEVLPESTKAVAYFRTSRGSSECRTQHGATNYNKANFNCSLSLQTLIS